MEPSIVILRFAAVFVLSLIFGLERQRSHKSISFGTFIFVSIGSCALAITAIALNPENPLPLLSGIVTGIGFLGAGALIKTADKVIGFTSAATIWLFATFGLVLGVGEYTVGIAVYSLIWIVVLFDRYLEMRGIGSYQKKMKISTTKIVSEAEIRAPINALTCRLVSMEINKKDNTLDAVYFVEGAKDEINKIPDKLFKKDWFGSLKIE